MKSGIRSAVLAIVLAIAGGIFWTVGKAQARLADAHKQLATLQYSDAAAQAEDAASGPGSRGLTRLAGDGQADARELQSTAQYWTGNYAALAPQRDAAGSIVETDPRVLMLAANAALRSDPGETDRSAMLRRLDAVVKSYAEVLKRDAGQVDAAYNYEYAIRTRDSLLKARGNAPAKAAAPLDSRMVTRTADDDLPAGPTLHGHPGGPPPKTDMAQFKIVIPKRGEERKDDPQAGKGGTKVRKG